MTPPANCCDPLPGERRPHASDPTPPVDVEAALAAIEGDLDLLAELNALFLEDWPARRDELARAIAAGDANAVQRCAHGVKGALAALGARPAAAAAAALEAVGRARQLEEAPARLVELVRQVERALPFLAGPAAGASS